MLREVTLPLREVCTLASRTEIIQLAQFAYLLYR
jgi:hypothetical protein